MITQSTLDLIREFEGVRYTAYRDIAGKWTIGVGHLIQPSEQSLLTATLTDQEVNDLLTKDLQEIQTCIQEHILLSLLQNQFDALASFTFNLGCQSLINSTLLKYINAGDSQIDITKQWLRWDKVNGQDSPAILARRQKEVSLYFRSSNV